MDKKELKRFEELTGNPPLSWQIRLYDQFVAGDLKSIIDLPTGLGKTMVMAIWLLAREKSPSLPRRLIYVVDRRTVVDQASDLAKRLRDNFGGDKLAISTLRGQLADNREWSRDPSKPAIIIGTVDLIGSALLFSGYRSSYKRRPLEAGLLGQDSLLVLDEAHLSKPFEKLICAINNDGLYQKDRQKKLHGTPMKVIRMSATSNEGAADNVFRLDTDRNSKTFDLWSKIENGKETNPIKQRFEANKRLTIKESKDVVDSIATEAGNIAAANLGSRIVIFVKSPKDVEAVRKAIIKKDKSHQTRIVQLTGTMRGLERDELVTPPSRDDQHERRVMQRFLNPDNDPPQGVCFLISTSAGEVGFDLNADHLVGDAATLDSWIQRLGRVNRRGNGEAIVILIKEKEPADKTAFEKACAAASNLFADGMDVSPKALTAFKKSLTPEQIDEASSPRPRMVELTDILLDAWSMTSIVEPMPGRPEVAPWLRGIADELPETTIAWRAELDLPGFDQLDLETIEEWFDTHRILTHETLGVPTSTAAKWFTDRWDKLDDKQKDEVGHRSIVIDRAGLKLVTVNEVIDQLGRNTDSIRNAELVLPASFGGIERGKGLLDANAPEVPTDAGKKPIEEQQLVSTQWNEAADIADIAPDRQRLREITIKPEDGEPATRSIDAGVKPKNPARFAVALESDDDRRVQLMSYVPKFEKPETGAEPQSLEKHVTRVRDYADDIIRRLDSKPGDPIRQALELAADWHDHGKNREFFQRTVGGTPSQSGRPWPERTRGKSGGQDFGKAPRGYRHEFGSLREFIDEHHQKINHEVFDLAMHLIAVHHGRGLPHFPKGGFDPDCESRSDEIHTESIRRFARLQRKYGWWHLAWLENLLRCADAMASLELNPDGGLK